MQKFRPGFKDALSIYIADEQDKGIVAWGTTVPADATAGYRPGCLFIDTDDTAGGFYINEGSVTSCDFNQIGSPDGGIVYADDIDLGFGGSSDVLMQWDTADANANLLKIQLPTGGAVNVPVIMIGQAINAVDQTIYDAAVNPTICMLGVGAVATGPGLDFRKARGTAAAPTVVTSADDLGSIRSFAAVAAGEWVQSTEILFECTGTVATTRGPGVITFKTATDAAPSVLTTALTISAAQLVTCAAGLTLTTGNLTFAAAGDVIAPANTATALDITDGTTALYSVDSRNTVSVVSHTIQGPAAQTLPNGATSRSRTISIPAKTVTLVGTTQVTTLNEGCQLEILAPTYNQSGGAVTVDKVSTLFVGTPVAGSSVTISTNHIIMTGTAGCFCTAAGTWTDTSSELSKKDIRSADPEEAYRLMDEVDVVKFRKIEGSDGDYDRFGVIAEKVPDFLASKTRTGVASIYLAGFALAAAKGVKAKFEAENQDLRRRLEALERR